MRKKLTVKSHKTQKFSVLTPLRGLFLLAARHSANKFALCSRSAASAPLCAPTEKLKSFPFSALRFPFIFTIFVLKFDIFLIQNIKTL